MNTEKKNMDHRFMVAHLFRRAGFGLRNDEFEIYSSFPYEQIVEDLLNPGPLEEEDEDVLLRYFDRIRGGGYPGRWLYRIFNGKNPLREKMTLFYHQVFATALSKVTSGTAMHNQIQMFRQFGLSSLSTMLLELSKDPAMIYWLDNNENHKDAPNENYGRELLELFSMGVGNYTEADIKTAARAFTGWTFKQPNPSYASCHPEVSFHYRDNDHDSGLKTFLGESGYFNGQDIIHIIVKRTETARFISRHLYNFFVSDEPPVSTWSTTEPKDPEAIKILVNAYLESDADIRHILRTLFNSNFFKTSYKARVKSPIELVAGIVKMVDKYNFPDPGIVKYIDKTARMGQSLMNPPTVEGWHTGTGWINAGTLTERVNFSIDEVGNKYNPGILSMLTHLETFGTIFPEQLVEICLDFVGPIKLEKATKKSLVKYATDEGPIDFDSDNNRDKNHARILNLIQLVVSSREYQLQ